MASSPNTGAARRAARASRLSWAALLVAIAALLVALTSGAIGLPGHGKVKPDDLSGRVTRQLSDPRAYALVVGPDDVRERFSRGVSDQDVFVNNGAFCIDGIGFQPKHVQVTPQVADAVPHVFLNEDVACHGGTAVVFNSNLSYPERFFVALYD
jgi:hypothetical protein